MNIFFLMDPLEGVKIHKDTSFAFMLAAQDRGHKIFYLPNDGMSRKESSIFFRAQELTVEDKEEQPFCVNPEEIYSEKQVDCLIIRREPPFDEEYLLNTWLLDLLPEDILIFNHPSGIRGVNEKIWASQFKDIVPPTVITNRKSDYLSFLEKEEEVILKPIDGFGGQGVFRILKEDLNRDVAFEILSQNEKKHIIVQKYLKSAQKGDKRIILLNGEPLGAVLRVHGEKDHRNNFFAGGRAVSTDLDEDDRKIISRLKAPLLKMGLNFVGIDVIGGKLIEVNVTSPTCIREMSRFQQVSLESKVIEWIEKVKLRS